MELVQKTIVLPVCQREAEIREGDGYSDRALLKKKKRIYQVIPDYLASMTVSIGGENATRKEILDLATPDQEFLAIEIYKLNYGDIFDFSFACPFCGHSTDGEADLDALEFIPAPDPPEVSGTLPRSGKQYAVGLLNGHKEQLLFAQISEGVPDLNQSDFQSLVSLDGSQNFGYEDVVRLPLADHKAIRKARKKLICGYDTTLNIECEKCGETSSVNILMHSDFLLPGG